MGGKLYTLMIETTTKMETDSANVKEFLENLVNKIPRPTHPGNEDCIFFLVHPFNC